MKKLLLFLSLVIFAGGFAANAKEQTLTVKGATGTLQNGETVTFGTKTLSYNTKTYLSLVSFSEDTNNEEAVIEIVPSRGSNNSNSPSYNQEGSLRLYPNNIIEVKAAKEGVKFTKLVFSLTNSSKYTNPSVSPGSGLADAITNPTTYTWSTDNATSSMTITMPSTSGKQFCFDKITVTYEGGSTLLGNLSATCNNEPVNESLIIDYGTTISFNAANSTSMELSVNGTTQKLDVNNNIATWTPGICENATVSVIAKREIEGEDAQVSAPLIFDLTVKAPALGELVVTYGEDSTPVESPVTVEQGTFFKFKADNATSFTVTVDNAEPIELTANDGVATWIPSTCKNAKISVVAKREVEGEETQISETASFTLTVKKVDYVIANWIIISAPSTAGGNKVDLDLTLDPIESSPGKWHAYAKSSYTSGISGGAQLGSTKNPFTDGTITLTDSDIPANAIIKEIIFNGFTNDAYTLAVTVNGESAGNITVAKSTAQDHKLSGFELTGNNVVFTATSASKYLCVKGISIKYTIPEEQPGEIVVDYTQQFCEEANEDKTELTMMAGAELRFSSMAAAKMEITTDEEGIELPEAVNEANITWTVPADIIATIKVTASSESGEKTSERVYTICSEDITPEIPKYIFENDSKSVMISTKAGALKIMAAPYTPTPEENTPMMAIEAQGWSFTPGNDPKSYEFSYEDMESTMNVSVKSVTPTKESDVVSFYVSNDGQVSGIENVATDVIAGEAVYYNLQGQRVNADRPGMYIRQQDGKAEKFIIR